MKLIGDISLIKAAVLSSKTWVPSIFSWAVQIPMDDLSLTLAPLLAFFVPHHHFLIFFSPTSLLSSRPKNTSPPPAHAIVLSIFCVRGFICCRPPHPTAIKNYSLLFFFPFDNLATPLQFKTWATNRFSRHFAPVLSRSSSTG